MPGQVVWNIAAPMVGLGLLLFALGAAAAWNVHQQQQTSSDLVNREVTAMLAIDELHMSMREIRYQLNMFLRNRDPRMLAAIAEIHEETDHLLDRARSLARTEREHELIKTVETGYDEFFRDFQAQAEPLGAAGTAAGAVRPPVPVTSEQARALTRLSDDVLTNQVLQPLRECLAVNQQVVERTEEASRATAQHLKIGFLLLGLCGGAAGLLMGTAISRAVGRSIIQLNVSVRGVAGRLSDVTGPVTFSRTGDLAGIESSLRTLEGDIASVVARLQQRETELLRTEQLARVGQLAAGLAHELRNPLMPMKMLVQAAIERGDEAGLKGRSLHVINEEIGRLEESIQSFLDFARLPNPEKTLVDIREVVTNTLELMKGRANQQSVELRLSLPVAPLEARVDRTQIRQLLVNLLLNALDALAQGGVIDVTVEPNAAPAFTSHDEQVAPADNWDDQARLTEHDALRIIYGEQTAERGNVAPRFAIRIADNGPGIPPDMLDSIFEPFVTTKESGTGLGLPICQRIAAAHGGKLTVQNREHGGAEFTLVLPYSDLEPSA